MFEVSPSIGPYKTSGRDKMSPENYLSRRMCQTSMRPNRGQRTKHSKSFIHWTATRFGLSLPLELSHWVEYSSDSLQYRSLHAEIGTSMVGNSEQFSRHSVVRQHRIIPLRDRHHGGHQVQISYLAIVTRSFPLHY